MPDAARRKLAASLLMAAVAFGLMTAFASQGIAQDPTEEAVCVEDAGEALRNAERFHELGTRNLMAARSVAWSGIRLHDIGPRAGRYVRRRDGGSLILYAWDAEDLCAFLWYHEGSGTIGRIYARMPGGAKRLRALGEEFRILVASGIAASGWGPTRQAVDVDEHAEAPQPRDLHTLAGELSALLFPAAFHPGLSATKSLSIIPVGAMSTIPLGLLEPVGDGRSSYDMFPLNILTLAEDIDTKLFGWVPGFRHAVILGDPEAGWPGWSFPALPGARQEARAAHSLFGGTLRIGAAADSSSLEEDAKTAELVIIAAHGVADPDDPVDGSFLALSDGPLNPRRIMELELSAAPLVVLSACQSGLGRSMDAGVIGLARAFQIAGATNTVMSLWNVDDEATLFQMSRFYENLRHMPPSAALRAAALATRERYPDPMRWAAFQVFGVSTVLKP